jgi:hypothetical protein
MIPTQKLKVKSSTEINCKIPTHKLEVTSRAQSTCFAPYLQPWEGGHSCKIPKVASRARANYAHLKTAKAHKMRTTLAPALCKNTLMPWQIAWSYPGWGATFCALSGFARDSVLRPTCALRLLKGAKPLVGCK